MGGGNSKNYANTGGESCDEHESFIGAESGFETDESPLVRPGEDSGARAKSGYGTIASALPTTPEHGGTARARITNLDLEVIKFPLRKEFEDVVKVPGYAGQRDCSGEPAERPIGYTVNANDDGYGWSTDDFCFDGDGTTPHIRYKTPQNCNYGVCGAGVDLIGAFRTNMFPLESEQGDFAALRLAIGILEPSGYCSESDYKDIMQDEERKDQLRSLYGAEAVEFASYSLVVIAMFFTREQRIKVDNIIKKNMFQWRGRSDMELCDLYLVRSLINLIGGTTTPYFFGNHASYRSAAAHRVKAVEVYMVVVHRYRVDVLLHPYQLYELGLADGSRNCVWLWYLPSLVINRRWVERRDLQEAFRVLTDLHPNTGCDERAPYSMANCLAILDIGQRRGFASILRRALERGAESEKYFAFAIMMMNVMCVQGSGSVSEDDFQCNKDAWWQYWLDHINGSVVRYFRILQDDMLGRRSSSMSTIDFRLYEEQFKYVPLVGPMLYCVFFDKDYNLVVPLACLAGLQKTDYLCVKYESSLDVLVRRIEESGIVNEEMMGEDGADVVARLAFYFTHEQCQRAEAIMASGSYEEKVMVSLSMWLVVCATAKDIVIGERSRDTKRAIEVHVYHYAISRLYLELMSGAGAGLEPLFYPFQIEELHLQGTTLRASELVSHVNVGNCWFFRRSAALIRYKLEENAAAGVDAYDSSLPPINAALSFLNKSQRERMERWSCGSDDDKYKMYVCLILIMLSPAFAEREDGSIDCDRASNAANRRNTWYEYRAEYDPVLGENFFAPGQCQRLFGRLTVAPSTEELSSTDDKYEDAANYSSDDDDLCSKGAAVPSVMSCTGAAQVGCVRRVSL